MTDHIFKDPGFQRAVFDAFPSPVLVLNRELRVLDANFSASRFFGEKRQLVLKRLCGEVLQCLHEKNSPEGCGQSPYCEDCVIRNAVSAAQEGKNVFRNKYDMQLSDGKDVRAVNFLVTASPFAFGEDSLSLIILEDVTELNLLKKIIPVCAQCKKFRIAENRWEGLESFLANNPEMEISHGICPDCAGRLYPDLKP